MSPEDPSRNLSDLTTMWSVVRKAKEGGGEEARAAQMLLLARYERAIRRFLLGALRDREAADELFQEFGLSLARGDFHRVDPRLGSFRGYVKRVLAHLIARHHKNRKREQDTRERFRQQLTPPASPAPPDQSLDESWREELLTRCAALLAGAEGRGGPPFATVLRLRHDHPQLRSEQLAELLGTRLNRPVSAEMARKWQQRAKEKYADLLLDEVASTLSDATADQLAEELIDLGLYEYCRPAMERRLRGH